MTPTSFKERQKQQRELEIIQAASQWISEHTYPDLNMDAIAEAVGISKPTLYQHFRSKDDLVAKVMIRAMEMLWEHLENLPPGSPRQQLIETYRMILNEKSSPGSLLAAVEMTQLITLLRTHPAIREIKDRVGGYLRRLIEEGKERGEINRDMPGELIVQYMFGTLHIIDATCPDKTDEKWLSRLEVYINAMTDAFGRVTAP